MGRQVCEADNVRKENTVINLVEFLIFYRNKKYSGNDDDDDDDDDDDNGSIMVMMLVTKRQIDKETANLKSRRVCLSALV